MAKNMITIDGSKPAGGELIRALSLIRQGKRELAQVVDYMLNNINSGDFTNIPRVFGAVRVEANGLAKAGAASSITLADADEAVDDYYNGMLIKIIEGAGVNQQNIISDFINATNLATVANSWTTTPDGTSRYEIYALDDVVGEYLYNLSNGASAELVADSNLNSLLDQIIAE